MEPENPDASPPPRLHSSISSLVSASSSSSSSSSRRFQVWNVSDVLQDIFRKIARRLGKKLSTATEEALQDWVEKHFDEANIPLDRLTIPRREFDFEGLGLPKEVQRGVESWINRWHLLSEEQKKSDRNFLYQWLGENQVQWLIEQVERENRRRHEMGEI